jgi:hypothetical protein
MSEDPGELYYKAMTQKDHLTPEDQFIIRRLRLDALIEQGVQLSHEMGGCTCNPHKPDPEICLYHYAATKQPNNHRIPWNCPTYYDGCNCGS